VSVGRQAWPMRGPPQLQVLPLCPEWTRFIWSERRFVPLPSHLEFEIGPIESPHNQWNKRGAKSLRSRRQVCHSCAVPGDSK
jgi:hypothetical protein